MFEYEFANAVAPIAQMDETSLATLYQKVAIRAYEYFEQRGGQHGWDLEDWIRAEREILAEMQPG